MKNQEIIQSLITAFEKSDTELILSHFTDDITWVMVGDRTLAGKETIREFFTTNPDMEMISSTVDHMVIDDKVGVVNGEVQCKNKAEGITHDMYYCDFYEFEKDKVKTMTSYMINKKKD